MIGIVDVGGGLRDIYGAGIFDRCIEEKMTFDYCLGVSAGSANIASFLAGQRGRNFRFYVEYSRRREYMSARNFLRKRAYIDLDYVYSTLANSDGEDPLNYPALRDNPARMKIVVTDAVTGGSVYFDKSDLRQDNYDVLKLSSNLPGICPAYPFRGGMYYDGGLSDPVPVERALADGCERVAVILTRPREFVRTIGKDRYFALAVRRKYPKTAQSLLKRYEVYNRQVEFAKRLEREGRALILAPDNLFGVDTLKRDPENLKALYQKGYEDAEKLREFLR